MDKLIYTAMTGAKHLMNRQASVANNLANINSTGFRAETMAFRVAPLLPGRPGEGQMTRYFAVDSTPGFDTSSGPLQQTGRSLDVAIEGQGWITVQADDGSEAYTRDGHLQVNETGALTSAGGRLVLGEGGPITVPADHTILIGRDGTISAAPAQNPSQIVQLGRLKFVNPDPAQLKKGSDGLIRLSAGGEADADATVQVASGALESSNVNAVEAMVSMIALARQFDMQMQMLKNAEQNAQASQRLLQT
jgi:flagellar basal-body rod protein FlgF